MDDTHRATSWINANDWDDPNMPVSKGKGMKTDLKTIEIDEIWWTSQSLPLDYGQGNNNDPNWNSHFKVSQEQLDGFGVKVSRYEYLKTIGGPSYISEGFDGVCYNANNHGTKMWGLYKPNPNPNTDENNKVLIESIVKPGKDYNAGHFSRRGDGTATIQFGGLANYLKNNKYTLNALTLTGDKDGGYATVQIEHNSQVIFKEKFAVVKGLNRWETNTDFSISGNYGIRIDLSKDENNREALLLFNFFEGVPAYSAHDKAIIGMWHLNGYDHAGSDPCLGVEINDYNPLILEETYKWRIPNDEHVMQLIGQAPNMHPNIYFRVKDFLNVTPQEATRISDRIVQTGSNVSGLTVYPTGSKGQPENEAWYSFGMLSLFRTGESALWIYDTVARFNLVTTNDGIEESLLFNKSSHSCPIRFCNVKTDAELGYSFYIDEEKDEVLMLPYKASSEIIEYLPYNKCYKNDGTPGSGDNFQPFWQMGLKMDITGAKALNVQFNTNGESSYIHLFDENMVFIKPLIVHPQGVTFYDNRISLKDVPSNAKYIVIHNNPGQYYEANLEYEDYDNRPIKQLRHGLERGIALRYTNRKHMKVLRSWSLIKQEAQDITNQVLKHY